MEGITAVLTTCLSSSTVPGQARPSSKHSLLVLRGHTAQLVTLVSHNICLTAEATQTGSGLPSILKNSVLSRGKDFAVSSSAFWVKKVNFSVSLSLLLLLAIPLSLSLTDTHTHTHSQIRLSGAIVVVFVVK